MKKMLIISLIIGSVVFIGTFTAGYSFGTNLEFEINPEAIKKDKAINKITKK